MENFAIAAAEKRGTPRVQKLFMTAYLPLDDEPARTQISLGRTVDISPSGVGMEIYNEVAVGTVMEMEIDLETMPVTAQGKVVRVDPLANGNFLIGIRFDEQQELLQTRIALVEIAALRRQLTQVESVLAELVETGWPWDTDGNPVRVSVDKDAFAAAMLEAKKLLGGASRSNAT